MGGTRWHQSVLGLDSAVCMLSSVPMTTTHHAPPPHASPTTHTPVAPTDRRGHAHADHYPTTGDVAHAAADVAVVVAMGVIAQRVPHAQLAPQSVMPSSGGGGGTPCRTADE